MSKLSYDKKTKKSKKRQLTPNKLNDIIKLLRELVKGLKFIVLIL